MHVKHAYVNLHLVVNTRGWAGGGGGGRSAQFLPLLVGGVIQAAAPLAVGCHCLAVQAVQLAAQM